MPYDPEIHHRRSIRLKDYDYSRAGAYFVTICAWQRECLFGGISGGKVSYSDAGEIISDVWHKLPDRFASIELDEFVIMPNHLHGVVVLNPPVGVGLALPGSTDTPKQIEGAASGAPTLGDIIRAFKSESSITVNRLLDRQGMPLWQRNYYEHVIRDESEMHAIREYIRNNPLKWDQDDENPANKSQAGSTHY